MASWKSLEVHLLLALCIVSQVNGGCLLDAEWRSKEWKLNVTNKRTFSISGMRHYTASQYEQWTCEDSSPSSSGGNWIYVVLSSSLHGVRCHRIYQDTNYMIFWTSQYPGVTPYSALDCETSSLYENTQPDILVSDTITNTGQGCFGTIRGSYYAQVSLSEQHRDVCNTDVTTSTAEITPFELILQSCVITGTLKCVGQIFAEFIGDAGADTAILFQNTTHPNIYYCARIRNDRDENRIFLSVDYTQRDEIVCDTQPNALTVADTPSAQYRAFSLMRLFCSGRNPCRNGGTCTEEDGIGFRCACAPGYNGITCNHLLFCVSSPCLNGGACQEGANTHDCVCIDGFAGDICEKAACEAGTRLDPDYPDLCLICPIGTYQPQALANECIVCPDGTTTQQEQRTSINDCVANCKPGDYIHASRQCRRCPVGTYQPDMARSACIDCPIGHITTQKGSHNIDLCIDVNPCDSNPCMAGSTCHADIRGYWCACPDFKGGVLCQIDTVPEILGIDPSYGPIAGGTVITVSGTSLQGDSELQVKLEGLECTVLSRNETHILIKTPDFSPDTPESQFTSESFEVELLYTPEHRVEITERFTYLPNPEIIDVLDLNTIATGGSAVTGKGRYMDSVAKPFILITLIYKEVLYTIPKTAQVITEQYSGPCFYNSDTLLRCNVPELSLPAGIDIPHLVRKRRDIVHNIYNYFTKTDGSVLHDVSKRGISDVKIFEGCDLLRQAPDEVEFYVDFILDGAAVLREEARELCVFKDPILVEFQPAVQEYKRNELLVIQVEPTFLT